VLAQLIKQGLGIYAPDSVLKAIVLNDILYTLPVYFGYLTAGQRHTLWRVLHAIELTVALLPITVILIY